MPSRAPVFAVVLLAALALGACESEPKKSACKGDAGCDTNMDAAVQNPNGKVLQGRVFDATSLRPIAMAEVSANVGKRDATTDADGKFDLTLEDTLGMLEVFRSGYAPARESAPKNGGYVEIFLKQVDERIQFRGDQGITVTLDNGVRLEIPADAVLDQAGQRVPGLVTLELAAVSGYARAEASALPGDGLARRKDGTEGLLAVETGLSIRILDADDGELDVDANKDVIAEVPAQGTGNDTSLVVYSYDEESERWREEGVAPSDDESGRKRYRGDIDHLSWWSFAKFYESVGCVRACVENGDGDPLRGAQVWVVGASVPGVSSFFTGTDGCGEGKVVAGAEVAIVAQAGELVSSVKKVKEDASSGCTDAGTFVLGAASDACPSGFQRCDDRCVDETLSGSTCAEADGGSDGSIPTPGDGGTANVSGILTDRYGNPVSGIDMKIAGQNTKSGADGRFSALNVPIPYAIVISQVDTSTAYGSDIQTAYFGITRTDPRVIFEGGTNAHSASLSGVITGGIGYPMPAGHRTDISCSGGPSGVTFGGIQNPPSTGGAWGPYNQAWPGGPSFTCTLFAMQYQFTPFVYTGMGSKVITLESGLSYDEPDTDITLAPVTTHPVTGNISVPAGATINSVRLGIATFGRTIVSPGAAYSIDVPDNVPSTVPMFLSVEGSLNGATLLQSQRITAATSTQDFVFSEPITLVTPAAAASNVPNSQAFTVQRPASSLAVLVFEWTTGDPDFGGTVDHTRTIHINGDSATLAALRAEVDLPGQTGMAWRATSTAPMASVDALLSPERDPLAPLYNSYALQRPVSLAP